MFAGEERKIFIQRKKEVLTTLHNMIDIIKILYINKELISSEVSRQEIDAATIINEMHSSINQLNEMEEILSNIEDMDEQVSQQFMNYIINELVVCPLQNCDYANNHIKNKLNYYFQKPKEDITDSNQGENRNIYNIILDDFPVCINDIRTRINQYTMFDKIKYIDNNIVMIGANGSGKSTFARRLGERLSDNVVILPAQYLMFYQERENIPITTSGINQLRNYQREAKLRISTSNQHVYWNIINNMFEALIADHLKRTDEYYCGASRKDSLMLQAVAIWNDLIVHRRLCFRDHNLYVETLDERAYEFNDLSDGEKAVFYYIGHILLAEDYAYIIVDEPETHFNLSICNKLWDKLEEVRGDCKFVYLTHDLEFASSRQSVTKIWNKSFIPPQNWDFEIIEQDDDIPEQLLLRLLGNRKNVCFCEGEDRNSLDYKVYSILLPKYTIIPVGGHLDVISYTNAYNKSKYFSDSSQAIGIIDGDRHLNEKISKWENMSIYCLKVNEVENMLCDMKVIKKADNHFNDGNSQLSKYDEQFWKYLSKEQANIAIRYVNCVINDCFKDNLLKEKRDINSLKAELSNLVSNVDVEGEYEKFLTRISKVILSKDYDEALRIIDLKGALIGRLARNIIDKYDERVFITLKRNTDLHSHLINTYFPEKLIEKIIA